jgi:Putative restriction endonuclease
MTVATRARGAEIAPPWAEVPGVAGPWRITADRYLELVDAGVFGARDRVSLWEGQIVEKMTKNRPHVVATLRLQAALAPLAAGAGFVEQEAPVRLAHRDDTLPEPDLKVVRGRDVDYADVPPASAVLLVVEVADSSLAPDRNEVLRKYAIEGMPVYWIANIPHRQIEVYRDPSGPSASPGYGSSAVFRPGQNVPVVLDGNDVGSIAVSAIFGDDDPWSKEDL